MTSGSGWRFRAASMRTRFHAAGSIVILAWSVVFTRLNPIRV